jgi:hypothetical protein
MASGMFSSRVTLRSKTLLWKGAEVPNDPMTMDAWSGFDDVRNWMGRSLWAWLRVSFIHCNRFYFLTKLTFPFPVPFMLRTKDSSRPVEGSVRVRNAWCGRFAVLPSVVVSCSFNVSVAPNEIALGNEAMGLSLQLIFN